MLLKAQAQKYAVPAFNIHNLETIQVAAKTAAHLKSPLILAATPSTFNTAGRDFLQAIMEVTAGNYPVPIAFHLDHHEDLEDIRTSLRLGCTSVMIDGSLLPYEDNVKKVHEVVALAALYGATVEAELGRLGGVEDDLVVDAKDAIYTNPTQALDFAERTGVDSLAVAIGTAHGKYEHRPVLDIERLSEIQKRVSIPLVLHGASDIPEETVRECIHRGICKVNIATDLKFPYGNALRQFLIEHPKENDPRKYMQPAKEAMEQVVEEKIRMCGSDNKA